VSLVSLKRCSVFATSFCLLLTLAFVLPLSAANTGRIYVTNSAGNSIDVVDSTTNKVVQVIKGIEVPHGVNFSPDGKRVYVSNESDHVLDVVDRESGNIIKTIPLSGRPNNIAVTKDGRQIFICIASAPGAMDIVDTTTMEMTKSIPMTAPLHNVYVTPDGRFAVAGSVRGKFAVAVDIETATIAWQIPFDQGVRPMAFDANPDGSTRHMFLQLSNFHGFVVVDFASHKETARIKFPDEPSGFGKQEGRLGTPSHGIGVAPDGKTLWVNSVLANAVFAYSLPDVKLIGHADLPTLDVAGRSPVGSTPDWLTFAPDSKTIYVADTALRMVSAIDMKSLKEVARIKVGEVPKRMNTLALP
jgi:YVTN family beta-propeller protein